ncbi:MAG: hypothetical protein U0795_20215 [Pirellulales bacterium]
MKFELPTQALFLDRPAVRKLLDDATIGPMNRIGGFIRRTARNSMRRKPFDKHSPPGSPPYAHVGLIKERMAYSYDPRRGSLVVGPMAINGAPSDTGGYTVPQLMEFGGTFQIREPKRIWVETPTSGSNKPKRKQPRDRQRVLLTAGTKLEYEPRPFMGPALAKARRADKLAAAFKSLNL